MSQIKHELVMEKEMREKTILDMDKSPGVLKHKIVRKSREIKMDKIVRASMGIAILAAGLFVVVCITNAVLLTFTDFKTGPLSEWLFIVSWMSVIIPALFGSCTAVYSDYYQRRA